ncbi:MAG: hypothetical protein HY769_06635 [Candidatus Stahlbacteria bacterium]|nr:hypothetical protein [Candidatus Stahlbacteria bacterium]
MFPLIIYSNEYSLYQAYQKFFGNGPHKLSSYIIKGSEKISLNSNLLSDEDYSIDYENSIIILNIPTTSQDTVLCVYEKLPFDFSKHYFHRQPTQKAETDEQKLEVAKQPPTPNPQPLTDSRLYLMGTKTFGISVGTDRDISFDQSMQINMNGKLSKNTRIEGTLRDDGTPLQPEGTTQELKEMDKVYVNVSSGNYSVRLGDFDFSPSYSKFGKIDRRLEGMIGKSQLEVMPLLNLKSQIEVGGALSKGRWIRKELTGITGKQGPYELSAQGITVAGSDKVWVNGKLVTRGKEYTIDYTAATIIFTAQLPIEDDDKIVIEGQQKDESYRRSAFIGSHTSDNFNVLLFKENDMKDYPLSFTITPERKDSLTKIDSTYAWITGATYIGAKKGSYIKKDSIYEYMGYLNGDYEVSFTRVPDADYEFDPILGGYKYVGTGNGAYVPKIRIPLPQSNLLVDVTYTKEINKIKFSIEGGVTKYKSNAFAQYEEMGKALAGQIEIGSQKWTLGGNFRNIDGSFRFPGTPDTLELKRGEVFLGLTPVSFLHTDTRIAKTIDDIQKSAEINLTIQKLPSLSYRYLINKLRTINEVSSSYYIRVFEPFIRYEIVNNKDSAQVNNREIGARSKWLNLVLKEELQNFKLDNRTSSISVLTTPLTLTYTYKQIFTNQVTACDLGNMIFAAKGVELAYDLTSLEHKMYEEEYYRVATQEGSFSRDSTTGRYYYDPHGDYEKRLIPSDRSAIYKNYRLSHNVTFNLNQDVYIKIGTLKQGEGNKIYFWQRTQKEIDDRNRISCGTKIFDIYANYSKVDYRANRTEEIMSSGDENVLEVNFHQEPYEIIYTSRGTRNWEQFEVAPLNLTWQEQANTIGTGYNLPFNLYTLRFLLQGDERQIDAPPYQTTHFYGLSGEPKVAYLFNDNNSVVGNPAASGGGGMKRIEGRFKLTNWFIKNDAPPNISVMYPPGISMQWGIDFVVLSAARTNYTISYQGTKIPNYSPDHTLNAEVRINF